MEHAVKLYTQRVAPNPTKLDLYLAEKAALGREIPLERIPINAAQGNGLGEELARGLERLQR